MLKCKNLGLLSAWAGSLLQRVNLWVIFSCTLSFSSAANQFLLDNLYFQCHQNVEALKMKGQE